jgi:hypothetical protein
MRNNPSNKWSWRTPFRFLCARTKGNLLLVTFAASVLLAGCVNPTSNSPGVISECYRSAGVSNSTTGQIHPQFVYTTAAQQKALIESYQRNGYHIIGICGCSRVEAFYLGADPIEKHIIAQAKQVKADIGSVLHCSGGNGDSQCASGHWLFRGRV